MLPRSTESLAQYVATNYQDPLPLLTLFAVSSATRSKPVLRVPKKASLLLHRDEVGGSTVTVSNPTVYRSQPQPSASYRVVPSTRNGVGATALQPTGYNQTVTTGREVERLTPVPLHLAREGNGSATPVAIPIPSPRKSHRTYEQTTGINLSGQFEKWGMAQSTQLTTAKLEFTNLTIQQLKQILQKLPPTCKANLEVSYLEDEQL